MLENIKKYFTNTPPTIGETLINDITEYLFKKLNVNKGQLCEIKIYYNDDSYSCIVRLKFDELYLKNSAGYFYFLVNYYQSEITIYGQVLQDSICDDNKKITWIHENKILKYYPEPKMMLMLSERI